MDYLLLIAFSSCLHFLLTRSQSLPVGIFIANLKRGDWNEKKKWRRRG